MAKISLGQTESTYYDQIGDVLAIRLKAHQRSPSSGQSAGDVVIFYNSKTAEILGFETRIKNNIECTRELNTSRLFSKLSTLKQGQITMQTPTIMGTPKAPLNIIGYDPENDVLHFSFGSNKRKEDGVDLGKGVIIRYDPKTKEWLGVSLLNVSEMIKAK